MKNKIIFIICFLVTCFLITSCQNCKNKSLSYREYRLIDKRHHSVIIKKYLYEDSLINFSHRIKYINLKNKQPISYLYLLSTDSIFKNIYIVNKDTSILSFTDKMAFEINDKYYEIYKFTQNKGSTDGEISHFWSPEYGIILIKSNTWKVHKKQINSFNENINEIVSILCDYIVNEPDFYYNKMPESKIKFTTPEIKN